MLKVKLSKCCRARLLHEGFAGFAVWRDVKGRKYSVLGVLVKESL